MFSIALANDSVFVVQYLVAATSLAIIPDVFVDAID